jgi:serine-type D-Ala-D-Ala carboxypeptidase (penicillin-binding protein 5/6)
MAVEDVMPRRAHSNKPIRESLIALALLAAVAAVAPASAQQQSREGFQTAAPHALLMDAATSAVLFEKGADDLVAPASMVKVMTAAVLFEEIKQGRLKLSDEFPISENAWRRGGAPSGGSAMFAALNSRVRIEDLIQGLVVQSGNDAAIAIAEGIAGNEANFAGLMNKRAREIGLTKSTFMNASGLPDDMQRVTARELARLAKYVIDTYPELYVYFGKPEFTWNKIRQSNRNPLIAMGIGADGLKTGYITDSGYSLVGSTVQNGQRLIVVVTGLKTGKDREQEARKLLDFGYRAFESRDLFAANAIVGDAKVYGGAVGSVPLVSKVPVKILLPRGTTDKITARIVYNGPLMPPVEAGAEVARLRVIRGTTQALDLPLYAAEDVRQGGLVRRALDAAVEFGSGFIRRAFSKS